MTKKISFKVWNKATAKNNEVNYTAGADDIIYKINNLYCCLETRAGINNVIVFSKKYDIGNVNSMLRFIRILYLQYNIYYIRVESIKNRYILFKRLFGMNMLLQPAVNGRDVYWCHISDDTIKMINEVFFNERTTK